jgi:hypothetical protein
MEAHYPDWCAMQPEISAAMAQADRDAKIRESMGWEDGGLDGWSGPDPFNPDPFNPDGFAIPESDWYAETGLPFPEDMNDGHRCLLTVMNAMGAAGADPYDRAIAAAKAVAVWMHNLNPQTHAYQGVAGGWLAGALGMKFMDIVHWNVVHGLSYEAAMKARSLATQARKDIS